MRDSNPHGQNPAVFKTAALPIRTNPPRGFFLKIEGADFVKRILEASAQDLINRHAICKACRGLIDALCIEELVSRLCDPKSVSFACIQLDDNVFIFLMNPGFSAI